MSVKPFLRLLRDGQLSALVGASGELKSFYRLGAEALNLWGAATQGPGRLPAEDEMVSQLREAGYSTVKTRNLIPGDRFMAFQAFRG